MRAKSATRSILIVLLLMSMGLALPQAGIAAYPQGQPGVEFAELALPLPSLAGPATAGGSQLDAQVGPAACTVPTTATVRGKSVQFDQCYEKAFSHGGTNYVVQVFYTEANSATNLNQCTAGENAANRCEHALSNNDDTNGDNVNAVAMADEAERAVRFYHDRNLNLLSGTTAQVYIAEDPRLGGVIWPNSIYVDDDAIDNNDTLQKRILAFHEMQHLVQDKYDGLTGWRDFFGEGIARTIEDRVDTALDADTGHLFIPEVDGILGSDIQRSSDLSTINYRSVLWWVWLMDQYRLGGEVEPVQGWPAIRDFYIELSTESDQVKALYDFVASKSSSFRKDFIDYTLALYAYRFNPTDPRLGFLDNEIRTATTGLRNHTVITTGPAFSTSSQAMNPRSSRYWEFNPANQCDYVAFSFDGNGKNYGFSVMTVDGGNLQKRWTSYGTGWSRTVRSTDLDRVVGVVTAVDDSGTVDIGRGCVQPTVNIKDPTSAAFAMVGLADNPRQFITRLDVRGADNSAVSGLLAGDFQVQIRKAGGGPLINATVVNAAYVQDNYWLVVQAPSDANGAQSGAFYDLIVTLGGSSDTESSALLYVERTQDVVIVLDRSGSMGGSTGKIEAARNAANLLVNELSADDQGGFVAFDGDAYLRVDLNPVTVGHRNDLFTAVSIETPGGVTSIGDGLFTAAAEEDSDGIAANLCSFVLLSDGHENEAEFWADVRPDVIDNGCSIHSIALGPGTNEPLMQQIAASVPGGSYDFATTSGGVPTSVATSGGAEVGPLGFLGWENNLSRVYDYKAAQIAGRQRLNSSNGGPAASACVDFEDLTLGARYVVGSLFADSGANILGKTFYWGNGTPYNGGYTEVGRQGLAGGSGNELQVNNINLAFDFGGPVAGLTLNAFHGGGNLNIEVNGDLANFGQFSEIDGAEIGGVKVSVAPIPGTRAVRLTLVGTINSFSIGGQELWIDDVCPQGPEGLQFYVDDASDKLVVAIAWQMNTKGTQAIQLYDPDGNPVSQSRRRLSPTGTNEVWEVPGPKAGFWKLVVQKLDQEYVVSATARTQYEMYLFVGTPVGSLSQGVRVPLLVTFVGRGKPLLGATVVATVRAPNGASHVLQLVDDGNHGDGEANDGIYGATYHVTHLAEEAAENPTEGEEPQVSGSYGITAVGTRGSLRREAQGSFAIQPGRDSDRDRIPDQWEIENGLDPKNGQDSGSDFDRDKLTAWCEYQLGTDPRNSDTDGGGEMDGSETGGLCVATTQNPLDPSDDRVGPLSSITVRPEVLKGRAIVRILLGQPLRGQFLSADVYRRTYSARGGLISDWEFIGATRQSEAVDSSVQEGLGYAYMAVPTIASGRQAQEGEATGRVLVSNIAYASPDPYPPSGSILINNGDAETNSLIVTLALSVDDTVSGHDGSAEESVPGSPPEQIQMRLSNTGEFGGVPWQPFRPSVDNWSLEPVRSGQAAKVYVQFKDAQGNVSETGLGQVDTIVYRSGLIYLPMIRRP